MDTFITTFSFIEKETWFYISMGDIFCVFADIENHFYLLKMKYSRKYKISYRKLTVETICKFCVFFLLGGELKLLQYFSR